MRFTIEKSEMCDMDSKTHANKCMTGLRTHRKGVYMNGASMWQTVKGKKEPKAVTQSLPYGG
jgi:hypothetical protein